MPNSNDGKKNKGNAVSGFLSYFYGNFIVLLLGFIQTPLVTRLMTTDEYGRTGMFETAVSVIYIFAILGMDQAYIRYYYKHGIDRGRLLKQCLGLSLSIVAVLIAVYLIFADKVNDYLFGIGTGGRHFDVTALVAGYTLICVFERYFFLDVRMQQNGRLYSNINIAQKLINIGLILGFALMLGNDFRVVLYAMTLSWGTTTAFLMIRYALKRRKAGQSAATVQGEKALGAEVDGEAPSYVNYTLGELLRYGAPYVLVLLMEWLLSSCDRVAIRTWSGFDELGVYSAAMKIMVLLITFKTTFVAFWSPVAMEKYENASQEECTAFFRRAFDITRLLCALAALGLILFRGIIVLLLGADYRGADVIIPFLTLMPVFAMLFEITNQGIKFKSKNMYLNIASAVTIAVNITGNALLVPRYGGAGAAAATGISYIIYFVIGSVFAEKFYPVGYDYKKTALSALLLIICAFAATFLGNGILCALICLAGAVILLVSERESLKLCISYAGECLRKLRHG